MLKQTPLHPIYAEYGAKVIDFGGWELPVQFSAIQKEHDAVRNQAGLFDVSHMGEVQITGNGAEAFLQQLTTNDVSKLVNGQCQYTFMCYDNGGVVDDLLVYKLDEQTYMLVINAANIDKDLAWMHEHKPENVSIEDLSPTTSLLALQGPAAERILQKLTDTDLSAITLFRFQANVAIAGMPALVSRTGYTGEDGFECCIRNEDAIAIWKALLEAGAEDGLIPAGLGARDTLRFEAKLPLYGQELSADITPIEAGLGFFVKPDKGEFIGRTVLAEQKENGAPRRLVGIEMIERGIPRSHYPVHCNGELIGEVTSGTQSPTLKKNVGLALIKREFAKEGTELAIEIRNNLVKAVVVPTPFYKRS